MTASLQPSVSTHVTLCGNRVSANIIELRWSHDGEPQINMISVLIRRKEETQRQTCTVGRWYVGSQRRKTPCDNVGRQLSDVSTSQGLLATSETKKKAWNSFSPKAVGYMALPTPWLTSSLQKCGKLSFWRVCYSRPKNEYTCQLEGGQQEKKADQPPSSSLPQSTSRPWKSDPPLSFLNFLKC